MFNFVLNIVFQLTLVLCGNRFSYEKQLFFSSLCCAIILGFIPIAVIFINNEFTSFLVTSILILMQGFANSIFQSSCYGVSGFLPFKFIIGVSFGNGLAGMVAGILKYIIIAILGSGNDNKTIIYSSLIYYGISVICMIFGVISIPILFRDPYFKANFYKSGEIESKEFEEILENYHVEDSQALLPQTNDKKTNYQYFKILMSKLFDTNFVIFIIFLMSFTVFPGVCFKLDLL